MVSAFSRWRRVVLVGLVLILPACTMLSEMDVPIFRTDAPAPASAPAMRWDHRPEAAAWTGAALAALETHASALPQSVPADIGAWCPAYPEATAADRALFWTGLMSALARHESTWNPEVVGGGDRFFGLMQISPATARFYGCEAHDGAALLDGAANISCTLRIWAETVPRDGVVARGRGGVAADWGPFSRADKREDMRGWVSSQAYCLR